MKATLSLPGGVVVRVEGAADEVRRVVKTLGRPEPHSPADAPGRGRVASRDEGPAPQTPDLAELVNAIKESDEFEAFDQHIFKRRRQLERVLLPMYVLGKTSGSTVGLTSGEISRVCAELGLRMSQPNAAGVLSGAGARFVIGNRTRVKGQAVRYRLSRPGTQYIESVLRGQPGGET